MKAIGRMFPSIIGMLVKKPYTVMYPAVPAKVQKDFRGELKFNKEKCIGCNLCTRVCPASAIEIEKVADKQFKAIVSLDKCIYCGQCVDSCRAGALKNTERFELASLNRKDLRVEI